VLNWRAYLSQRLSPFIVSVCLGHETRCSRHSVEGSIERKEEPSGVCIQLVIEGDGESIDGGGTGSSLGGPRARDGQLRLFLWFFRPVPLSPSWLLAGLKFSPLHNQYRQRANAYVIFGCVADKTAAWLASDGSAWQQWSGV
jgi:hypothetical protein